MKLKPYYNISHKKPPHFWIMKLVFKSDWERIAFAFGDTIYSKYPLPDHFIHHERIHLHQQKYSKVYAWWWLFRYITSKKYRYAMELEAFTRHWGFFKDRYPHDKFMFLNRIAENLSGELYGNMVTKQEAIEAIKNGNNFK